VRRGASWAKASESGDHAARFAESRRLRESIRIGLLRALEKAMEAAQAARSLIERK